MFEVATITMEVESLGMDGVDHSVDPSQRNRVSLRTALVIW